MLYKLHNDLKSLLKDGRVKYIIGYAKGTLKFTTTPLITQKEEGIEKLVINPFIVHNLSNYLPKIKDGVAVLVKGCDSRSLVSLIQDNKVKRDKVVIVGIACEGLIDIRKVEKCLNTDSDLIDAIKREGDEVIVEFNGEKHTFPLKDVAFDKCLECKFPTPKEYDILIENESKQRGVEEVNEIGEDELEGMEEAERWEFWKEQFKKCIFCYACREICPACFCETCFMDVNIPQWISPVPRWQNNFPYQLVRIMHTAGRCTDCGECERACPMNIPLRKLTRKICKAVEELFGYTAGADVKAEPFLASYKEEDTQDFFL